MPNPHHNRRRAAGANRTAKTYKLRTPLTPEQVESVHISRFLALAHCTAIDMALHDGISWELMNPDEQRVWKHIKRVKDEIMKRYTAGMPESELDQLEEFAGELYAASMRCIHREH